MTKHGEGRCTHPREQRVRLKDQRVRCGRCGHEFRPRGARIFHGTYNGYCKHKRDGTRRWPWPISEDDPCGCLAAAKEWRREYAARPENKGPNRARGAARMEALARLRRAFPSLYAQFYSEEYRRLGGDGTVQARQQDWDGLVRRLVKVALDCDEAEALVHIRGGWGTVRETEVIRLASRIRVLLSETTHRRRPDNGSA